VREELFAVIADFGAVDPAVTSLIEVGDRLARGR
jgi:hypothetical protein